MRFWLATCLLLAFTISSPLDAEPAETAAPLTPEQYVEVLDRALGTLQAIGDNRQSGYDFERALPFGWHVKTADKEFEVSTEPVRRAVADWQAHGNKASLDEAAEYLETLRENAQGYGAATRGFSSSQHTRLGEILSRREFQNVHGQTWLDRFSQRIKDILIRFLGRAFTSSTIPAISSIVVYTLIAVAVLAVAYWLYRSLRASTQLETIMPVAVPISAKQWPVWLAEARLAASRSAWRDAVHLAYWAGISFLEAQGTWRPDRARTPREYLRLLPASSPHQAALFALTRRLEGVWYGMHGVGPEGFEQAVAELERLGCRCN